MFGLMIYTIYQLKINPQYGKADNDVHYLDEEYKQLANSAVCTIKVYI